MKELVGKRIKGFYIQDGGWCKGTIKEMKVVGVMQQDKRVTAHSWKIRIEWDKHPACWEDFPAPHLEIITKESQSDENEDIKRKVMKLLSLASSPVKAEAELAMQKAEELMMEYNIDRKEFDKQATEKFTEDYMPLGSKLYEEHLLVARLCKDFFHIEFFIDHNYNHEKYDEHTEYGKRSWTRDCKGLTFAGKPVHVEIAEYVFAYLVYLFRELFREEKEAYDKEHEGIARYNDWGHEDENGKFDEDGEPIGLDRVDFMQGLSRGLYDKLYATHKQMKHKYGELMVVDKDPDLKKWVDAHHKLESYSRSSNGGTGDGSSFGRGKKRGSNIDIHDGIGSGKNSPVKRLGGSV